MTLLKVTNEDGTVVKEFKDESEFNSLLKNSQTIKDLQKENENLQKEVKPDWREARDKIKTQEELITQYKEKFGDLTNSQKEEKKEEIEKAKEEMKKAGVSLEDIEKTATKAALRVSIENKKNELLVGVNDPEEKKVVLSYFEKLSAGEELTMDKIVSIMDQAKKLGLPPNHNTFNRYGSPSSGGAPNYSRPESEVSETTKQMGSVFGISEEDFKKGGEVRDAILN